MTDSIDSNIKLGYGASSDDFIEEGARVTANGDFLFTKVKFSLNDCQLSVLKEVAKAEMRSPRQMLSLLLIEGIRFYYADYYPQTGERPDLDELEKMLTEDAQSYTQF